MTSPQPVNINIVDIGDHQITMRVVGDTMVVTLEGQIIDANGRTWGTVNAQRTSDQLTPEDLASAQGWSARTKVALLQVLAAQQSPP